MRVTALLSTAVALLLASPVSAQLSKKDLTKHFIKPEEILRDYFHVERKSLDWTHVGGDGSYIEKSRLGGLAIKHITDTDRPEKLLRSNYAKDAANGYTDYFLQPSGQQLLLATNTYQRYLYSFEANYYIHNVETRSTTPLTDNQQGNIQYACWAPSGNTIAYVKGNNLYIWQNGASTKITRDGGPGKYHGIPGWLYEEEVFKSNNLMWFSPDGRKLAYLSLDETQLVSHEVPFYADGASSGRGEPGKVQLRYSKPGEALPKVTLHVLDLYNLAAPPLAFPIRDFVDGAIVGEVVWVTDTSERLLFRLFSRDQRREMVILRDLTTNVQRVLRYRTVNTGWLDNYRAIRYLPGSNHYIDMSDASGWKHLYVHNLDGIADPIALTRGEWDVDSIVHVDAKKKVLFYTSSERDPAERHLYSVGLNGKNKKMLVKSVEGVWSASFSTGGEYYILTHEGPHLPYQVVYYTGSSLQKLVGVFNEKKESKVLNKVEGLLSKGTHIHKRIKILTDNKALKETLTQYHVPTTRWSRIETLNEKLSVMEHLPPNFDPKKQYAVVFDLRATLGRQGTTKKFHPVDFHSYLAGHQQLQVIVVTIDVHGTAQRGREFLSRVGGHVGYHEARDIIEIAVQYKKFPYVNPDKMILMGTGYGGYLAAKLTEVNTKLFAAVIMTAPIVDWRSTNSIYTERYMGLPSSNERGYDYTAIRLADGFKQTRGSILIQHISVDVNGHLQDSASMVDMLKAKGVPERKLQQEWYIADDTTPNNPEVLKSVYIAIAEHIYREKVRVESPSQTDFQPK
ncbi:DPP6-like protein [Diplocarpon rosae]|nr:DPP6-like protein [Diplocarpon rosae]